MTITTKFIRLSALNILFLLLAYLLNISLIVFFIYNLLLLLLLIYDYFISPSENLFVLQRLNTEKISIATEYDMNILINNNSNYKVKLEIIDETPPLHFKIIDTSG